RRHTSFSRDWSSDVCSSDLAYRGGDSVTNVISPMMSYFALIVAIMQRYDRKSGLGTLIATMLPYSVGFLLIWLSLLVVWILFGIPLGPDARSEEHTSELQPREKLLCRPLPEQQ